MKFLLIIILIFFTNHVFANENEVENTEEIEVINLYETKSLDQMVLDNLNKDKEIEEIAENKNNEIEVKQIKISKDNFIFNIGIKELKIYL